MGDRHRAGGPRPGDVGRQAVLRRRDRLRRRAEHPGLAGRRRLSWHAAGHQPALRRAGGAHRPRPQREDKPAQRVRPQELFLSGPAGRLPDQPIQGPDRRRRRRDGGHGRRHEPRGPDRAAAPGAGRRQIHPRHGPEAHLRRSQPGRCRTHGDRLEAGSALGRRSGRLSRQAALDPALSRHLRRQHGAGLAARRRQRLGAPAGGPARHALRDQESQLDPLYQAGHRTRGAPADRNSGGRREDRAGDPAVRSRPRRNPGDALKGGSARLPLFPRPGPAAAGTGPGLGRGDQGGPAGTAGCEEGALRFGLRPECRRRRRSCRRPRGCGILRGCRPRPQGPEARR